MMNTIVAKPLAKQPKIAIVVSQFNEEVTSKLLLGAQTRLRELLVHDALIVWVPGAVEIPLIAQRLAASNQYQAIIALGAVIRGDTSHYDYVCKQVSDGCQKISLQYDLPVIFGILTTENEQQALDRAGGVHGNKGADAVDAAFAMISLLGQLL
jgi:6,7-dimethyl-8-ribityllumazine synthase